MAGVRGSTGATLTGVEAVRDPGSVAGGPAGRAGRGRWALAVVLVVLLGGGQGWPASRSARVLAPGVVEAAAGETAIQEASEPAAGPGEIAVPVILVHGLGGGANAWDADRGMAKELREAGYRDGYTLFTADYSEESNGDYASIYRRYLLPLIDRAKAATGSQKVDLVASSMGGLVCRYYINSSSYRNDVRSLVLIASPGHGSFAANILRSAAEVERQAAAERAAALISRADFDRPGSGRRGPAGPPDPSRYLHPFSPGEYVKARAQAAYAPLLRQYEARLAAQEDGLRSRQGGFEQWLATARSEVFEAEILGRQLPPDPSPYAGGGVFGPPQAGQDLTLAYYELLAINVAQEALARGRRGRAPNLGDTVTALGRRAAEAIAGQANVDPDGVALDRLLEEYADVPAEVREDGSTAYLPVQANYYLGYWNAVERLRRAAGEERDVFAGADLPHPDVKYVIAAGAVPNFWQAVFPAVNDNDLVVEVSSAYLPLGENDAFRLFTGSGASHLSLKNNRQVVRYVLKHLRDFYPTRDSFSPAVTRRWWRVGERLKRGAAAITPWEPTYLEVRNDRLGGPGRLTLRVELPDPGPEAGQPQFWLYLENDGGTRIERRELALGPKRGWFGRRLLAGTATIEDFGPGAGRVLLGARLGGVSPGERDTLASFARDRLNFEYRLEFEPLTTRGNRLALPALAPAGAGQGVPGPIGQAASTGPEGPPVIDVKRITRETTHLEEDRTYHARWEWDFGDGSRWQDRDPLHIRSDTTHVFSAPGSYAVRAASYSNKGTVLRQKIWPITIPAPPAAGGKPRPFTPASRTFSLETVREARPVWKLAGPARWITGRQAEFRAEPRVDEPPHVERLEVTVDPGRVFSVVWERPGTFTVKAAVVVRTRYRFPEGAIEIKNVYVKSREVEVVTTAITE